MIPGRKLRIKYLGPYKIVKTKPNDTYDVERVGNGEGPMISSTCVQYIKLWSSFK